MFIWNFFVNALYIYILYVLVYPYLLLGILDCNGQTLEINLCRWVELKIYFVFCWHQDFIGTSGNTVTISNQTFNFRKNADLNMIGLHVFDL